MLNNKQAVLDHIYDVQKKTTNDTIDLDVENNKLSYKFSTVNIQPEVYKTMQKQQEKLSNAKAKAKNDSLKTNLELQKQKKKLQIENALMSATNGILNETIKDDNNNETKNEEEKTDLNDLQNTNDNYGIYQSEFTNQIEKMTEMKKKFNDEQE